MSSASYLDFMPKQLVSLPNILWQAYLTYLWNYTPNSWVARIASSFRVFAFLLILPILVLALLDISAYVIARTLGVVQVTSASTSDKSATPQHNVPAVTISNSPSSPSALHSLDVSQPHAYFTSEENSLKLSGASIFSQPPSPVLTRRGLQPLDRQDDEQDDGLRRRK